MPLWQPAHSPEPDSPGAAEPVQRIGEARDARRIGDGAQVGRQHAERPAEIAAIGDQPFDVRQLVLELGDPLSQASRYAGAWATVLPSMFESFGMVLVESLACGTPIVVADHAAPPELVRPGAGRVTQHGDPESLADGLRDALALAKKPETVDRCRAVASDYSWARLAERLEALYSRQ